MLPFGCMITFEMERRCCSREVCRHGNCAMCISGHMKEEHVVRNFRLRGPQKATSGAPLVTFHEDDVLPFFLIPLHFLEGGGGGGI